MSFLQNKSVLITGANRGIGAALVDEALDLGATRVYAASRRPAAYTDERVIPIQLDLTDTDQISAAAARVESLDVLVNNAGIALYDDLTDPASVRQQFEVNVLGPLAVTNAFLPQLTTSRGHIVNNLSLNAIAPMPMIAGYSMSKAAGYSMTQSLRSLLARRGITVHAVLTGPVDTDMSRGADIPKAAPSAAAAAIFEGLEHNQEEIFPDPMSAQFSAGWAAGAAKVLEQQYAAAAAAMATA